MAKLITKEQMAEQESYIMKLKEEICVMLLKTDTQN